MKDVIDNKPLGSLKISEDVIASIAKVAAEEVKGVASFTEFTVGSIQRFARNKKSIFSPIVVKVNDDVAEIDLYLNLYSTARLKDTASAIQKNVKAAVQNMTGITVYKVNVHVGEIVFEEDDPSEN